MKAENSHASQISNSGNEFLENLIDTYELIAGVFKELGGQNNFTPKLDRTLPFISGRTDLVRKILYLFISDLVQSHGTDWKSNYMFVSHSQEKNCWIFNFHPLDTLEESDYWNKTALETTNPTLAPFSLLIPKSSIRDTFSNSNITNL
ncbi:hypothetical protein [Algoriphagus mannitolivorans]|uniref:hypothetical protein n=1 Tax=Algoriphagus mannitolivorans TaxID=226504 RepID=UPI0004013FAE|nr:hypothetical protein [Algoriphagus mannitolivorans]